MRWIKKYWFIAFIISAFTACKQEKIETAPDISDIEVEMSLRRFEKDLFSLDTNQMARSMEDLSSVYPAFSNIYFNQILGTADPSVKNSIGTVNYVKGFINFPAIQRLKDTCDFIFGDLEPEMASFEKAFKYLNHYFPKLPTPDITTFISEYSVGAFIYKQNSLAVGLDFFLGSTYPYAQFNPANPAFSAYLTRTFNRDHLVSKTMRVLVEDVTGPPGGSKMLDLMIHRGKQMFILDQVLPHVADTAVLEYSKDQLDWLVENETEIWAFFLTEDLLYSTDMQKYRKYVDYSPNSPGMPIEAPGRTANWMGYQIVKAYMKKVPQATLKNLIELKDAQELLDRSRYRPPRR